MGTDYTIKKTLTPIKRKSPQKFDLVTICFFIPLQLLLATSDSFLYSSKGKIFVYKDKFAQTLLKRDTTIWNLIFGEGTKI